jgi:hypothetical protein
MSFDPVSAALGIGGKLIDRLWPDPAQRDAAKVKLMEMQQTGELAKLASETDLAKAQIAVNQVEAASPRLWVSGWRPYVGWVGGTGLAYAAILEPLARFVATLAGYTGAFPVLDTTITMQILFALLGVGALRTREKEKGVAAK